MADKLKALSLLGLGCLLLNQHDRKDYSRGEAKIPKYKAYTSDRYDITFEYPADWTQNKEYSERYEGAQGFVEVADISGVGRNIDEVTEQEIDSPIHPYGTNPKVESFTLDGEPARLIIPSPDQEKIFGREVALIVKNKRPVIEGQDEYDYTIIWSDMGNIGHIIQTFKFI